MKKSMIWISAVLYTALGIVVISLILAAGLPLINNIKDKNTFTETKEIMLVIDNTIRQVLSEGIGSKRTLFLEIKKGNLYIDEQDNNKIIWMMTTKTLLQEPEIVIEEVTIRSYLNESIIIGEYQANLELDYSSIDLTLKSTNKNVLSGSFNLVIQNNGISTDKQIIEIQT